MLNAASMQIIQGGKKSSTNLSRCKADAITSYKCIRSMIKGKTNFGKVTKSHHQTQQVVS
jgi:hypothetical protein